MAENDLWMDLARATVMVVSNRPQERVDALYLHGLSEGMVASANLFDFAKRFYLEGRAGRITFNGSDGEGMGEQNKPGAAWPGKNWYINEFDARGLYIPSLALTGPGLHTRDETDKLVAFAKEYGWKSVAVLSVAYHAVRSMSCLVASMDTAGYWMKTYFVAPPRTNWWLPMKGSQGLEDTDSFREAEVEAKKVVQKYWQGGTGSPGYWKKGWGIPPKYLFHYLQYRDRIVAEQKFPLFSLE